MENKKRFNKEKLQSKKEKIKVLMEKCNVQKAKELIMQNKTQSISILVAVIVIIAIALTVTMQPSTQIKIESSQELAKAKTYEQVKAGENAVEGTDNVKFDAFFLRDLNNDGYAESIRGTCKEIGARDTLYMELKVQTEGYLKDAKIVVNGKNFKFQTTLIKDAEIKENYIGNDIKEIEFNQLNNGMQKLLTGVVSSVIGKDINNYSRVNSVTLTGTYVGEDGVEKPIEKTVNFNIDWYGTAKASIYSTYQSKNVENAIKDGKVVNVEFTVNPVETQKQLILKSNHVEGTIPEFNGFKPIDVVYKGDNATFNYNKETMAFTIDRESTVDENGIVKKSLTSSNSYKISVTYPIEAYQKLGAETFQLRIPVRTYYEGYNNQSEEFISPYKSNTAIGTILVIYDKPIPPTGHIYRTEFSIYIKEYPSNKRSISRQNALRYYMGTSEKNDMYTVIWNGYVGTKAELDGMTMRETKNGQQQVTDNFIKIDATQESANEIVSNIGIYFTGATGLLGDSGWIKVYDDETGELLETFTKDTWNTYTAKEPYKYRMPVKHIRVETSKIIKNEASLSVYNIKEIDNEKLTTKYTREQFARIQNIESTLVGSLAGKEIETRKETISYIYPQSRASLSISKKTITTQETDKNEKIEIKAYVNDTQNDIGWQNGIFWVKIPERIIDIQINKVTIDNTAVKIENYEIIEENNERFIKIVTKNNTPKTYTITINADITPDPRVETTTERIELYASNETEYDYIKENSDSEEAKMQYKDYEDISLISPNSLLTHQTASDFDDGKGFIISPQIADIRPQYAVVDHEEKKVTIGAQITNNYASTISEIKILGKIPFEGNTYVIAGRNIGSTFSTKMESTGIIVPEEVKGIAKVYYSENGNPTTEINDEANGWKTAEEITNWDNIKTYIIDLENYTMPSKKQLIFNYKIRIPNGVEFNKVSYSHHGVYFSIDTENGKYKTKTEPNRLGLRIAEKFDIELQKYQKEKEKVVKGAIYSIKEITEDEEETVEGKTRETNEEGILNITNLYAERIYEIKEIETPDDYKLNEDRIRFIAHVSDKGILTVEKLQGNTKEDISVIKNEGENYKLLAKVEDEVKASLKIIKQEEGTDNKIARVRYRIKGEGLPENGRTSSTNTLGELMIRGLLLNKEYTLQEEKAEGYYLADSIKFKVVNSEGTYDVQVIEGAVKTNRLQEINGIPTVEFILENQKCPRFDLEITKIKRINNKQISTDEIIAKNETLDSSGEVKYLEGAKFRLYKGATEIGEYITDSNGKITITGLYQSKEDRGLKQVYTLKEAFAPQGYVETEDITFEVEEIDGKLKLKTESSKEPKYIEEENTIKLVIEDIPSFRLLKQEKETEEPIANVKFAIYNVEDETQPVRNGKGEIFGTEEIIDGEKYYTITTDEKGEITADLEEGLYKVVEIQAPEQYKINGTTYYFGVGKSRGSQTDYVVAWEQDINASTITKTSDGGYITAGSKNITKINDTGEMEWQKKFPGSSDRIEQIIETSDGGYLVGGYFYSSTINLGDGVTLTNNGSTDGMLIKYASDGKVEWAEVVGGSKNDSISSIIETKDGGYLVEGYFNSSTIDLGSGVTLTNNRSGYSDVMLIKYASDGKVEWAKGIGGDRYDSVNSIIETQDGGYLVGGDFSSSTIDLGDGVTLTNNGSTSYSDIMLIKYASDGKVEWAKVIGGDRYDYVNSIIETQDGGYLVGGYFYSSTINLGDGVTLTSNGGQDGMLIKYASDGKVEWAKIIGGNRTDSVNSIIKTQDGGYLVGGSFDSSTIDLENGVILTYNRDDTLYYNEINRSNGMVIKYASDGKVEGQNQ